MSTISASYNGSAKRPRTAARKPVARGISSGMMESKSSILQDPVHRRAFHATARRARDHHFDTLKFVQRLQEEGFTEAQSVAMMKVLSDVIEER